MTRVIVVLLSIVITTSVSGQAAPARILFTNVNVFDGFSDSLAMNVGVLVEGNPLKDLDLVADPHKNFVLIIKDGKIYKNTLDN